jgi:N6-adenosine-specific RNA methylase IME4
MREAHYPTVAIDDILALPVAELAANDAVLLLWATTPVLPQALAVMGMAFEYKTNLVWVKDRGGTGY